MSTLLRALALLVVAGLPFALAAPQEAAGQACACLDRDGDRQCGGPPDVALSDADWLNGPTSGLGGNFPGEIFILPEGCNKLQTAAVPGGISVNAKHIIIRGQLTSTATTGEGILFTATKDVIVEPGSGGNRPLLVSGGHNSLADTTANAGVARASVGLRAGRTCWVTSADLTGNPFSDPLDSSSGGLIGMQCAGDLNLHDSILRAGGIDVQALAGQILAHGGQGGPVAIECDSPVTNLLGNGNSNGVVDAADFPCRIKFADETDILDFCTPDITLLPNRFRAVKLTMIANAGMRLDNPTYPGNIFEGTARLLFAAANGPIDFTNADLANPIPPDRLSPTWAIYAFADPVTVNRAPVLLETMVGPNVGQVTIDGACFSSTRDVIFVGALTVPPLGTPKPGNSSVTGAACKTAAQFVPIVSGP